MSRKMSSEPLIMTDPDSTGSTGAPAAPAAPHMVGSGGGGIPPNIQQMVASKRLQQAQAQVGEVVDIMRVNVEKVLERDSKLSELDKRADDLQEGASQFQQQAVKLKKKYWWENVKIWLIIGIIVLIIVIIVILSTTGQQMAANAVSGAVSKERVMGDTSGDSGLAAVAPVPDSAGTPAVVPTAAPPTLPPVATAAAAAQPGGGV